MEVDTFKRWLLRKVYHCIEQQSQDSKQLFDFTVTIVDETFLYQLDDKNVYKLCVCLGMACMFGK